MALVEVTFTVDPDGTGQYLSVEEWEAAEVTNALITNDERYTVICRTTGGSADTTALAFSSTWATDATHYLQIWTDPSESYRHDGTYRSDKYRWEVPGNVSPVTIGGSGPGFVRFIGLQVTVSTTLANRHGFSLSPSGGSLRVEQSVIRAGTIGANVGGVMGISIGGGATALISNNIVYGFDDHGGFAVNVGINASGSGTIRIFNNTVVDCEVGFRTTNTGDVVAINCIAQDCADGFNGTWDTGTDYNCSDIASDAPGANSVTGEVAFLSETAGSENFHLDPSDTVAFGNGTNLSTDLAYPITVDIDNETRVNWSIGADDGPIAVSISMDALAVATALRDLTIVPGAVSLPLDALPILLTARDLTIIPGAVSIPMDALAVDLDALAISIETGPTSVALDALAAQCTATDLTVVPGTVALSLDALVCDMEARDLTVVPGAASALMAARAVVFSAPTLTIDSGVTVVAMEALTVEILARTLTVVPGAAILILDPVSVDLAAEALAVQTGPVVILASVQSVALLARSLTIAPGAVTALLDVLAVTFSAQTLTIVVEDAGEIISLQPLSISLEARDLAIVPGAVSIALDALSVEMLVRAIRVRGGALPLGEGRTAIVEAEDRIAIVYADGRTLHVIAEGTAAPAAESRIAIVPADPGRGKA